MRTSRFRGLFLTPLLGILLLLGLGAGCAGETSPPAISAYCQVADRLNALDLFSDPTAPAVRAGLGEVLRLTRRAARVAPAKIKADAEAAVLAQERFNALFARNDWDFVTTNLDPAFTELSQDIELAGTYRRLEEYRSQTCSPFDEEIA